MLGLKECATTTQTALYIFDTRSLIGLELVKNAVMVALYAPDVLLSLPPQC